MYCCEACGKFFDDPVVNIITEPSFYGFDPPEREDLCPYCSSEDFREAEYCDRCGNWVKELHVDYDLCPRCMDDLGINDEEHEDA